MLKLRFTFRIRNLKKILNYEKKICNSSNILTTTISSSVASIVTSLLNNHLLDNFSYKTKTFNKNKNTIVIQYIPPP